jgi:hypothetical protein
VGLVANALFVLSSDDFDDSRSLVNIAKTIRASILRSRDPTFLEAYLATADGLMRQMAHRKELANMVFFSNDIFVNSNYRHDWANLVDLGYTDQCRFYTAWTERDRDGAEVVFLIEKDMKEKLISAWRHDVQHHFENLRT